MGTYKLRQSFLGVVGDAAQNSPLPARLLTHLPSSRERIEAGSFYEINHSNLPNDAPSVLYSLRAIMVTTKTEQTVTIRYPSIQSLQAFFGNTHRSSSAASAIRSTLYPATDEKYVMSTKLALRVLGQQISSREFVEHRHSKSFWLIKYYETQHLERKPAAAPVSNSKNGTCLSMLKHTGMNWGSRQIQLVQASAVKHPDDDDGEEPRSLPLGYGKGVIKEEDIHEVEVKLEECPESMVKDIIQYSRKRKCQKPPVLSQYNNKKIKHNPKHKPIEIIPKLEVSRGDRVDRWSAMRYERAVTQLVEVLKSEKAFYGHPIARATLRTEARKKIGDTGLLDHLLKHLAGKVVPTGGAERLRRRCDCDGKMEYWLEDANLANIRQEAGVKDPYWTPPPGWKPGDCLNVHTCICCNEVRLLKDELDSMRRSLTEMKHKDEQQQATTPVLLLESASSSGRVDMATSNARNSKESYELLVKKKSVMEEQLHKMSKALIELEEDMKKLSSKADEEASGKPLMITHTKNQTAVERNETNSTSSEETSEEESSDDDDDQEEEEIEGEREVKKPIRLKACRGQSTDMSNITTSHEVAVVGTPCSTSPHSTTTS